jgi:hypothetical protein
MPIDSSSIAYKAESHVRLSNTRGSAMALDQSNHLPSLAQVRCRDDQAGGDNGIPDDFDWNELSNMVATMSLCNLTGQCL